jgi:hypothetical protein
VPRLGEKLVLVEGRDRGGSRIAGGCEPLGDVEADTRLVITAEVVARVRSVPASQGVAFDPSSPPTSFPVALLRPWRDGGGLLGIGGVDVEIDLRDRAADRERIATVTSCGGTGPACTAGVVEGLATVPLTMVKDTLVPPLAPGPVEVVVRAPWTEEPLVVRAFEPPTPSTRATVNLAPAATPRAENLVPAPWAFLRDDGLTGAAVFVSDATERSYRIVLVDSVAEQLVLRRRELEVAEPVFAVSPGATPSGPAPPAAGAASTPTTPPSGRRRAAPRPPPPS